MDEINLAVHCKLLDSGEVLELLNKIPKKTDVVLTGRYGPKELVERADFINEVKDIKYRRKYPQQRASNIELVEVLSACVWLSQILNLVIEEEV